MLELYTSQWTGTGLCPTTTISMIVLKRKLSYLILYLLLEFRSSPPVRLKSNHPQPQLCTARLNIIYSENKCAPAVLYYRVNILVFDFFKGNIMYLCVLFYNIIHLDAMDLDGEVSADELPILGFQDEPDDSDVEISDSSSRVFCGFVMGTKEEDQALGDGAISTEIKLPIVACLRISP